MPVLGAGSQANLQGVHPDFRGVIEEAITTCPIDFKITSGVRTTAEQKKLWAQGRSDPGRIVTYADGVRNKSNHQAKEDGYGYAIDFVPLPVDWNDPVPFAFVAGWIMRVAEQRGVTIEWGGFWSKKKRDYPHLQMVPR